MRVDSGAWKTAKNGGYIHRLTDAPITFVPVARRPAPEKASTLDCVALQERFTHDLIYDDLVKLAKYLGVTDTSLLQLGIGYDEKQGAFTFPMSLPFVGIVGFRVRNWDGDKWSVTGSRNALFIPSHVPDGMLFIVEGPTDVAALLTVGLAAIGRPSNTGGAEDVVKFCGAIRPPRQIVILHDRDAPGSTAEKLTEQGASKLAAQLNGASVMCPPRHKDVRAWVNAGGKKSTILCVAEAGRIK